MKISKFIALGTLVLLASCGQEGQVQQVASYDMLTLAPSSRTVNTMYSASINGRQDIAIYPQVSGAITEVAVEEGSTVRKGQTLFIIDQIPYKAALATAQANVKAAEAGLASATLTYENKKTLFEKNVVSEADFIMAQNNKMTAEAQLAQAKAMEVNAKNNLSYTVVKSPSNGVISVLPYKVGALVSPALQHPLTTVSDNSVMFVYFSMNENQLLSMIRQYGSKAEALKNMPAVQLKLSDGSIYSETGKIEAISGVIDKSTGSVVIKAAFDNASELLHSGASGNVIIPTEVKDCIILPKEATFEIQDKIFAYKVVDGVANSTEIKVKNLKDPKVYFVESGLAEGDVVIASGAGLVRNGMKVQPKQAEEKPVEKAAEKAE